MLIGLAEQLGSVYAPTYSVVLTFLIMALVLAFRPQGLLGAGADGERRGGRYRQRLAATRQAAPPSLARSGCRVA